MTLAIRLDDGTLITDPGWHTVADVMAGAHGHGIRRMPGELVALADVMTLRCLKCPRQWWRGWRMPRTAYRRVTDWAGIPTARVARFRCDGCGYERPFTTEWANAHTDHLDTQETP